jgi:surfactin synthase thioesterase subunit
VTAASPFVPCRRRYPELKKLDFSHRMCVGDYAIMCNHELHARSAELLARWPPLRKAHRQYPFDDNGPFKGYVKWWIPGYRDDLMQRLAWESRQIIFSTQTSALVGYAAHQSIENVNGFRPVIAQWYMDASEAAGGNAGDWISPEALSWCKGLAIPEQVPVDLEKPDTVSPETPAGAFERFVHTAVQTLRDMYPIMPQASQSTEPVCVYFYVRGFMNDVECILDELVGTSDIEHHILPDKRSVVATLRDKCRLSALALAQHSDELISEYATAVLDVLLAGNKVILCGHSLGGIVVGALAVALARVQAPTQELRALTAAPQFVPNKKQYPEVSRVDLCHIFALGDIALRCTPDLLSESRKRIGKYAQLRDSSNMIQLADAREPYRGRVFWFSPHLAPEDQGQYDFWLAVPGVDDRKLDKERRRMYALKREHLASRWSMPSTNGSTAFELQVHAHNLYAMMLKQRTSVVRAGLDLAWAARLQASAAAAASAIRPPPPPLSSAPPEPEQVPTVHLFYAPGVGCRDEQEGGWFSVQRLYKKELRFERLQIRVMCELDASPDADQGLCISGTGRWPRPRCSDQWVGELVAALNKGATVILAGYSHGAVVVNVIASMLSSKRAVDLSRLHVVTSASPYMPSEKQTRELAQRASEVRNFVCLGDKVARCDKNLLERARELMSDWRALRYRHDPKRLGSAFDDGGPFANRVEWWIPGEGDVSDEVVDNSAAELAQSNVQGNTKNGQIMHNAPSNLRHIERFVARVYLEAAAYATRVGDTDTTPWFTGKTFLRLGEMRCTGFDPKAEFPEVYRAWAANPAAGLEGDAAAAARA